MDVLDSPIFKFECPILYDMITILFLLWNKGYPTYVNQLYVIQQ